MIIGDVCGLVKMSVIGLVMRKLSIASMWSLERHNWRALYVERPKLTLQAVF